MNDPFGFLGVDGSRFKAKALTGYIKYQKLLKAAVCGVVLLCTVKLIINRSKPFCKRLAFRCYSMWHSNELCARMMVQRRERHTEKCLGGKLFMYSQMNVNDCSFVVSSKRKSSKAARSINTKTEHFLEPPNSITKV